MAINSRPCKECVHYDPIIRGDKRVTRRGWCAARSEYPTLEPEGRLFPPGVRRVAAGELARPFIVVGRDIVPHCTLVREKRVAS
jgi:hypothetical protein